MRFIVKCCQASAAPIRCNYPNFSTATVDVKHVASQLKELSELWDLQKYPIELADNGKSILPSEWLEEARRDLIEKNYVLLPNLVPSNGIRKVMEEVGRFPKASYYSSSMTHNILLEENDEAKETIVLSSEESEAENVLSELEQESRKTLVAYDNFQDGSPLRQLYNSEILRQVVSYVLTPPGANERKTIYTSADHMGAAYLNVFEQGDQLGWHFDRSQFFVNLVLQTATSGGDFQFAWDHDSRKCPSYASLNKIVVEDAEEKANENLHTLSPQSGTLMIFAGNRAMHRVTPVQSDQPRINVIFTFESKPDIVLNEYTREKFFGRKE